MTSRRQSVTTPTPGPANYCFLCATAESSTTTLSAYAWNWVHRSLDLSTSCGLDDQLGQIQLCAPCQNQITRLQGLLKDLERLEKELGDVREEIEVKLGQANNKPRRGRQAGQLRPEDEELRKKIFSELQSRRISTVLSWRSKSDQQNEASDPDPTRIATNISVPKLGAQVQELQETNQILEALPPFDNDDDDDIDFKHEMSFLVNSDSHLHLEQAILSNLPCSDDELDQVEKNLENDAICQRSESQVFSLIKRETELPPSSLPYPTPGHRLVVDHSDTINSVQTPSARPLVTVSHLVAEFEPETDVSEAEAHSDPDPDFEPESDPDFELNQTKHQPQLRKSIRHKNRPNSKARTNRTPSVTSEKVDDTRKYQCPICKAKFKRKYHLNRHDLTHNPNPENALSKETIRSKRHRNSRIRNVAKKVKDPNQKKHQCHLCEAEFDRKPLLNRHVRTHNPKKVDLEQDHDTKKYQCELCGSKFRRKYHLDRHAQIHNLEKPSDDNIAKNCQCHFCGAAFARSYNLERHVRSRHGGARPFTCSTCPKTFTSKFYLDNHTRVHTGERPHQCEVCGKSFTQSSTLLTHRIVHKPEHELPYPCHVCPKRCRDKVVLQRHLATVHSEPGTGSVAKPQIHPKQLIL